MFNSIISTNLALGRMHMQRDAMIATRYPTVWNVSATEVAWYLVWVSMEE